MNSDPWTQVVVYYQPLTWTKMFVPPADTRGCGGSYEEHVEFPLAQGLLNRGASISQWSVDTTVR